MCTCLFVKALSDMRFLLVRYKDRIEYLTLLTNRLQAGFASPSLRNSDNQAAERKSVIRDVGPVATKSV